MKLKAQRVTMHIQVMFHFALTKNIILQSSLEHNYRTLTQIYSISASLAPLSPICYITSFNNGISYM